MTLVTPQQLNYSTPTGCARALQEAALQLQAAADAFFGGRYASAKSHLYTAKTFTDPVYLHWFKAHEL